MEGTVMVVKKKKTAAKVQAVVLDEEKLHGLIASLSVDGGQEGLGQLARTLQACLELSEPVQQIQLVKKAGSQLEALSEQEPDGALLQACLHALALVYTSLQAKNPLRRAIASALSSAPAWMQEPALGTLSACLSDCLSDPASERYPHAMDTVAACLDSFPLGERCINKLLPEVLQFIHKGLSEYLHLNSGLTGRHIAQAQLMQSCLAAVKTSVLVIQRCQETMGGSLRAELEDTLSRLLGCYTHILTDEEFVQSVQSTAGLAVVLLIRSVMGCGDEVASVVCSLLRSSPPGLDSAPRWLKQRCEGLCAGGRPAGVSLYLCHGALAMLSWRGALPGPQWEELLLLVPNTLLDLDVSIKESSTAMVVARVLTLWSSAALDCLQAGGQPCPPRLRRSLSGGSELQRHLLEHIYSHWEHPLDGVRHQTRSLFRNLLLLHQRANPPAPDPPEDPYVSELTRSLLGLEWHMRGKYGSLGCLVELYGAGHLLAVQPQLPSHLVGLMGDQNLAPYASDLLERLFVSHKAQLADEAGAAGEAATRDWMERWHQTWVTPLLRVLCRARLDQTTYILDYFLPKLLRCSPSSLAHMVQALQDTAPPCHAGSRGALGALMTCLRAAKAQGVVPSSKEGLWGGLVPLSLLQRALVHKHDQVRMDALGLVCESHRSTEAVSSQEMELVRHFLPPNLNSQAPGVRQQTVSLLKKLLCRLKDSAVLLQRRLIQEREQEQRDGDQRTLRQYKEFLRWLCVTLLEVLLPGSSFSKCLTSLHLLCLLGEFFTFSTGPDVFALGEAVTSAHAQNVLYCVASNFLEVKQLAATLLRQLPPSAVGLQVPERTLSVLQAALDLSTSTKPFDSVTAAHLLHLLLRQPDLGAALLHCAREQGLEVPPPPSTPTQPSEGAVLELNALAAVQFLLRCLQSEVSRSESSLLQAAASYPLYGRAHCITAVLQHLNTESLSHTEQWRCVVSELVAVCYRMSDVVSPVVQSSSPEGLIPMDTDSETSAGLQRILQEIQPRDTNDFFTSARELNTERMDDRHSTRTPTLNTGGEGYRVTAQMVLVCCWRSMKEVAMLLGQLCQSLPLHCTTDTHSGLITEEQVEGVGLYFRQQLLQSRHRGAFELAYVGFVRLTDMLCRSGSPALQQLPARWLSEVLEEVKSSDPSSKLCATRRSAGIPFYVQALLSSEPKSSSCSLLKMTMRELISLAGPSAIGTTDSSTVPQVHALNILRALYRDTRLGENVIPFVSDGMQAAVLGFTSPVWAVRNSSTLLFSTLITRIFGVKKGKDEHSKKNRMTGREFFTRFPALYPFLLNQLEEAAATVESGSGQVKLHPSLFLLLLVLSRLYPSPMDGSSSPLGLAPFMPFIIRCGRSAVYRTREMAARALVPFVLVTQVPSTVHKLLQELPEQPAAGIQHNHVHGTLLQVLFLLRSYQTDSHRPLPAGSGITEGLRGSMWLASRQNGCEVTRGAFLDVLVCLCGPRVSLLDDTEVCDLRREALSVLTASELVASDSPASSRGPGGTQYLLSLARVALSAAVDVPELWGGPRPSGRLLRCLLQCPQYEVRELALEGVLKRLQEEEEEEEEEEEQKRRRRRWRRPEWLDETTLSNLTALALHETHPRCLAKVLTVLRVLSSSAALEWRDGPRRLSREDALQRLLALAQSSAHSVELHCAALTLVSQLVVQLVNSDPQGASAVVGLAEWGSLVCSCCGEEQPVEVKLMAAEVLVSCTATVLTSTLLPLGLSTSLSLWRSLFTLLQDEDQDVRDSASDFICNVPAPLLSIDVTGASVCPAVALDAGVGLLCRLLELWGRTAEGVLALTEWLLGDKEAGEYLAAAADEAPGLDEEDFLFEKGDLNLWAEPVQWAKLLHGHVCSLIRAPGAAWPDQGPRIHPLLTRARAQALSSQRGLDSLPALPQFSSAMEHARLVLRLQRATLAVDVLDRLR
ncbi:thyroid adenoma-associated protein isoform X2 [Gasterosteus aculeatus]